MASPEQRLEILHDHYKETFARIREMEKTRDRLFLIVIALFALLFVEIGYPAEFGGAIESLTVLGTEVKLGALPFTAIRTASWVFTLAVTLRYLQVAVAIERQYPYLHKLEDAISPMVSGGSLYRREGRVYLEDYPPILNAAWVAYVFLFPAIALIATIMLVVLEWWRLSSPWPFTVVDTVVAAALFFFLFTYRFQAYVIRRPPAFMRRITRPRWLAGGQWPFHRS